MFIKQTLLGLQRSFYKKSNGPHSMEHDAKQYSQEKALGKSQSLYTVQDFKSPRDRNVFLSKEAIKVSDLEYLAVIGQGNYGKVKLALHKPTNQHVAVKILKKKRIFSVITKIREEINALRSIKSNFVVSLYKVMEDEDKIYMIQEYANGGDLRRVLSRRKTLSEDEARFFFVEVFLGVLDVHKHNIVIRDLKPENILLDGLGHVRLCDFGLCKRLKKGELTSSFCGTLDYMPPEIVFHKSDGQGISGDYWALGCVLFEMLVGNTPFYDEDDKICTDNIVNYKWNLPSTLSPDAQGMLLLLLELDPKIRLKNVSKIKKHPWLKKLNWKEAETSKLTPPINLIKEITFGEKRSDSESGIPLTKLEREIFKALSEDCKIETIDRYDPSDGDQSDGYVSFNKR